MTKGRNLKGYVTPEELFFCETDVQTITYKSSEWATRVRIYQIPYYHTFVYDMCLDRPPSPLSDDDFKHLVARICSELPSPFLFGQATARVLL